VASSYAKWKCTGQLTQSGFVKAIGIGTQGLLDEVGAVALKNMQDITRKHDASGELTDSLMWTTAGHSSNMGSRAEESEKLEKPKDPYTVLIGSMAEHAIYRETTSGIHTRPDRPELFVERMKQWYRDRFNMDPETPENEHGFWKLVGIVAKTVTNGVPFVAPTKDMAVPYAKSKFAKVMDAAVKARK